MTEQKPAVDLAQLINQHQVEAPPKVFDQEAKEALADAGTPFTINGISYGDDKDFGPYFEFDVDIQGERATFRLGSNEKRDPFLASLANAAGTQAITGVRLRAISTRGGNKFLVVEPAGAQ